MTLPVALAGAALAAAGCGGGASSGSSTAGATGAVAGTVATLSTTTASGGASFDVRFGRLKRQLSRGLQQVESGNAADKLVGGGTILTACSDSVTNQLGTRATTPQQRQSVSQLRTACTDAAQAAAKLKAGDTAAAERLARTALQEIGQAG